MPIRNYHRFTSRIPSAKYLIEWTGKIQKLWSRGRIVFTKYPEGALPFVRCERVERFVVQSRDHFSDGFLRVRSGDNRRPGFLLSRLQFRREMFPSEDEVLIFPWHGNFA